MIKQRVQSRRSEQTLVARFTTIALLETVLRRIFTGSSFVASSHGIEDDLWMIKGRLDQCFWSDFGGSETAKLEGFASGHRLDGRLIRRKQVLREGGAFISWGAWCELSNRTHVIEALQQTDHGPPGEKRNEAEDPHEAACL